MVSPGALRIANSIYDAAFKYLLDDNRSKMTRNRGISPKVTMHRRNGANRPRSFMSPKKAPGNAWRVSLQENPFSE